MFAEKHRRFRILVAVFKIFIVAGIDGCLVDGSLSLLKRHYIWQSSRQSAYKTDCIDTVYVCVPLLDCRCRSLAAWRSVFDLLFFLLCLHRWVYTVAMPQTSAGPWSRRVLLTTRNTITATDRPTDPNYHDNISDNSVPTDWQCLKLLSLMSYRFYTLFGWRTRLSTNGILCALFVGRFLVLVTSGGVRLDYCWLIVFYCYFFFISLFITSFLFVVVPFYCLSWQVAACLLLLLSLYCRSFRALLSALFLCLIFNICCCCCYLA